MNERSIRQQFARLIYMIPKDHITTDDWESIALIMGVLIDQDYFDSEIDNRQSKQNRTRMAFNELLALLSDLTLTGEQWLAITKRAGLLADDDK